MLLPSIGIFLFMFYPYGFEKNVISYSTTEMVPPDSVKYNYFLGNNEIIEKDINNNYTIDQQALEKSTLSKTVISKFFGTSFGLDEICLHNINSTWSIPEHRLNVELNIIFGFNGKHISVSPRQEKCELIFASDKFSLILNQGASPTIANAWNTLSTNKEIQRFVDKNHLNMTDIDIQHWLPIIYTESYVKISPITYVISGILIFIAWSGFILLCREIRDFIK